MIALDKDKLLASPLKEALEFFAKNKLKYKLIQTKPPNKKIKAESELGKKRIINITEKEDFLEIIWSFQYND
ncbi:MAG: hypothetical protein ACOCQE_04315 [Halanaerobium sp.]